MRRVLLISAFIFLATAVAWGWLSGAASRIPEGWSWKADFVGTVSWADPETGVFPEVGELGLYERRLSIDPESDGSTSVTLKDEYEIHDPVTGETTWHYVVHPRVDPVTGLHVDPAHEGQYAVFPRNVDPRRSYELRMNYLEGVPLNFIREDVIEGLRVYLFGYRGPAEYTESYIGTAEFPGVPVAAGQEIRCADANFSFMVWVEPLTGEILKLAERCESGDYVFDVSTGAPLFGILRWGGETMGIDVLQRAEWIRSEQLRLRVAEYGPLALGFVGVGLAAAGFMRARRPS